MKLVHRSFGFLLLVLFSVQILAAYFSSDQCHHAHEMKTASSHAPVSHLQGNILNAPQEREAHCNTFGFCLSGHCHTAHLSILISLGPSVPSFDFHAVLGLPRENVLKSLLAQDRPWQPPRA